MENKPTWLEITLNLMSRMRDEGGTRCDGILQTEDGTRIDVHRVALASRSQYFREMFLSRPSEPFYIIPNVTTTALKEILNFIYKKQLQLSLPETKNLIPIVDRFQVDGLAKKCFDILEGKIDTDTVIGIYNFVQQYDTIFDPNVMMKAKHFLLKRFEEVVNKSSEYEAEMKHDLLGGLLSDDELVVSDEKFVFEAIVKWIEHDDDRRKRHFPSLLRNLRVGLLDEGFVLNTVQTNQHFKKYLDKCFSAIRRAGQLGERVPSKILMTIGGWSNGSPTNIMETYDYKKKRWSQVPYGYASSRAYHETVVVDGLLYLIGGFDGIRHFNGLSCYNPQTKTWSEKSSMFNQRCYVSATVLDGKIYALGGYDGQRRMNSVECYNPSTNRWSEIRAMNEVRSDASAVTLNGKIYIMGGFTGTNVLQSAEVYDPKTLSWTFIQNMATRRSGVSAKSSEFRVFVLGGFDGVQRLSSCERYNPSFDHWTLIESMTIPRSNFTCCLLQNEIYVLGGFDGNTTTNRTESYDIDKDVWTRRPSLSVDRSALACCILNDVPNRKEYFPASFPNN